MTDAPRSCVEPRNQEQTMKQPKEPKIRVVVNRSTEAIDFDAWAAKWVRAAIAVDAEQQRQQEAA